jgi:glycosyltransferase involved in cell wall biosynthesis
VRRSTLRSWAGPPIVLTKLKPLVSILIPAFNSEEWIADTIRSALSQDWPRKEIIVIDDGSSDGTLGVARQFASRDILVHSQENRGVCAARNAAFGFCQGDFVQWLDADDILDSGKISAQMALYEACQDPRVLFSSAWGTFYYRISAYRSRPSSLWMNLDPVEFLCRKLRENVFMASFCWLASRQLTEEAGNWDSRLLKDNDGEYFCRLVALSRQIHFAPRARGFYRFSGSQSVSNVGFSSAKLDSQFLSNKLQIDYLRSLEDSPRTRLACLRYLQRYLDDYFYPARPDIVSEMHQLAAELGGELKTPRLPWKYHWIQKTFGWNVARRIQRTVPMLKNRFMQASDRFSSQVCG